LEIKAKERQEQERKKNQFSNSQSYWFEKYPEEVFSNDDTNFPSLSSNHETINQTLVDTQRNGNWDEINEGMSWPSLNNEEIRLEIPERNLWTNILKSKESTKKINKKKILYSW